MEELIRNHPLIIFLLLLTMFLLFGPLLNFYIKALEIMGSEEDKRKLKGSQEPEQGLKVQHVYDGKIFPRRI